MGSKESWVFYEVYIPVTDEDDATFPPALFREAFDNLAERFGFIETWSVYLPKEVANAGVIERELYRYQVDVPDTDENLRWLIHWRDSQSVRFRTNTIWMIRYRPQD